MARNWSHTSLGQVADWSSGTTPSKARRDYWSGDIPWVSPKDMKRFELHDTQDHISQRAVDAGAKLVPPDTVFVVVRGMILAHTFPVCIGQRAMSFNQDVKALAPHEGTHGRFLAYWLQGRADKLLRIVTEATHGTKRIELRDLQSTRLELPQIEEQQRIAEILDTLDEAIRRAEQVVAKLKQVKQGLLHGLLTCGIDDNGELRDPIRHPESFKDSPIGLVPDQWEVGRLEAWLLTPPKNGYSPEASAEWTGWLMLGLGCLTRDGFAPIQLKNAPRCDRRLPSVRLTNDDLLMSRANTRDLVGLVGRFKDVGVPCTYPDLMMRLMPQPARSSAAFMELVLASARLRRQIQAAAVGTSESMVKISAKIVRQLRVAMPDVSEQERIVRAFEGAQERLAREESGALKLQMLKHGLMENLLTGHVRVTGSRSASRRDDAPQGQLGLKL